MAFREYDFGQGMALALVISVSVLVVAGILMLAINKASSYE